MQLYGTGTPSSQVITLAQSTCLMHRQQTPAPCSNASISSYIAQVAVAPCVADDLERGLKLGLLAYDGLPWYFIGFGATVLCAIREGIPRK